MYTLKRERVLRIIEMRWKNGERKPAYRIKIESIKQGI